MSEYLQANLGKMESSYQRRINETNASTDVKYGRSVGKVKSMAFPSEIWPMKAVNELANRAFIERVMSQLRTGRYLDDIKIQEVKEWMAKVGFQGFNPKEMGENLIQKAYDYYTQHRDEKQRIIVDQARILSDPEAEQLRMKILKEEATPEEKVAFEHHAFHVNNESLVMEKVADLIVKAIVISVERGTKIRSMRTSSSPEGRLIIEELITILKVQDFALQERRKDVVTLARICMCFPVIAVMVAALSTSSAVTPSLMDTKIKGYNPAFCHPAFPALLPQHHVKSKVVLQAFLLYQYEFTRVITKGKGIKTKSSLQKTLRYVLAAYNSPLYSEDERWLIMCTMNATGTVFVGLQKGEDGVLTPGRKERQSLELSPWIIKAADKVLKDYNISIEDIEGGGGADEDPDDDSTMALRAMAKMMLAEERIRTRKRRKVKQEEPLSELEMDVEGGDPGTSY